MHTRSSEKSRRHLIPALSGDLLSDFMSWSAGNRASPKSPDEVPVHPEKPQPQTPPERPHQPEQPQEPGPQELPSQPESPESPTPPEF